MCSFIFVPYMRPLARTHVPGIFRMGHVFTCIGRGTGCFFRTGLGLYGRKETKDPLSTEKRNNGANVQQYRGVFEST